VVATLAKWPLRYLIALELIYVLYELFLARNSGHESPAIILGLLLVAVTLPSSLILFYLAIYLADWVGYKGSDSKELLPRLIGAQVAFLLNTAFVAWLAVSSEQRSHRNAAYRQAHDRHV
jgi:hypothetical protein